jgi:hypothetical protein
MLYVERVKWLVPSQVKPSDSVLVHMMWNPYEGLEKNYYYPPTPPQDLDFGEWLITPWSLGGDRIARMDRMFKATVNIFQDFEDFLYVTTEDDRVWCVPVEQEYIVARYQDSFEVPNGN